MNNYNNVDFDKPIWLREKTISEVLFCEEYIATHKIIYTNGAFFTPEGRLTDLKVLESEIYDQIKFFADSNVPRKIKNIIDVLKIAATVDDFPPDERAIHVANGSLYLDGNFKTKKNEVVKARLPISYNPDAGEPKLWLSFLDELLYEEDIPTLQEYMGYCLIPSNKAQKMMIIKGNGGEGKSQIGVVIKSILGSNVKDGSIGKISENRFARADLEHMLLCVDDDMRMDALKQTNYIKSTVTALEKMDLEKKGKQSYQGWMRCRFLVFSNGDLTALYDKSDGFYRRQLVLTTKPKSENRVDDPDIAMKMKAESEGIFLWAFEGLQRLISNQFRFTQSQRIIDNRNMVKRENNNISEFLDSDGYITFEENASIPSVDLYKVYLLWCGENNVPPLKQRSFSNDLIKIMDKYSITNDNNVKNDAGRRVRGFHGIRSTLRNNYYNDGFISISERTYVPDDNPFLND